jgi:hypothetical protein
VRKNPERLAWTVLATAFVAFCVLITSIPLGIRFYLLNAYSDQDTQLERIEGTIQVRKAEGSAPLAVTDAATLSPGDRVVLGSTDWASLGLFERSNVFLFGNTDVELTSVRSPRFDMSEQPNEVVLTLAAGMVRAGVALPTDRATRFQVLTPHATLNLTEGSYRIEVTNPTTQITVVRGEAIVRSGSTRMKLLQGMRTRVDLAGGVADPLPAAQNLVVNSNFQEPLFTGWLTRPVALDPMVTPPSIELSEDGGRQAVRLVRRESDDGNHTEAHLYQRLDYDVRDFRVLEITLDVLLEFQSLSGGGQQSSEFPIIVRLNYKDRWGNDQFWTHGFYYQNRDNYTIASDAWGRPLGEQITRGVWYPYESGNLFELLGDAAPVHVTGIDVYASGWNYDSLVTEIQLIVE